MTEVTGTSTIAISVIRTKPPTPSRSYERGLIERYIVSIICIVNKGAVADCTYLILSRAVCCDMVHRSLIANHDMALETVSRYRKFDNPCIGIVWMAGVTLV
jgi:hypothetical protein